MRGIILHLVFLFSLSYHAVSQDLDYAQAVINDLTAPDMHGRGYVSDGELIAARYIKKEFKKLGLKKSTPKYFQPFDISVNTFPGAMKLSLNNMALVPGKDFMVYPGSPSLEGEFESCYIPLAELLDDQLWLTTIARSTGRFVLLEDIASDPDTLTPEEKDKFSYRIDFFRHNPGCPAAGTILFTQNKLSWGASTREFSRPFFTVIADVDPELLTRITVNVENEFFRSYQTQNMIGMIEGKKYKDSLIFLTAHYDHLGRMGENVYFPGANDNASGVAMILNLAAYYSKEENRPDYTLVFLALGAEELGILGSGYYVAHPVLPLDRIAFLINIDLAGNGQDGITVVNGSMFPGPFNAIKKINDKNRYLPVVRKRGPACNSDHCPFYEVGVPSFFIYTMGGSTAYHDIYDTPENLPLTMFENYFKLLKTFIDTLQIIR